MDMFDKMYALKDRLTPIAGFNVVGVDMFSEPGDADLYLVGHFETREEAEAELKRQLAQQSTDPSYINDKYYIYESTTR